MKFTRSGAIGRLSCDHFDFAAEPGFLRGGFARTNEGEIDVALDDPAAKG